VPHHFAETPDGLLLAASGFDPMLRWDGFAGEMESAGVIGPVSGPTLSGSGTGAIVGTYYGYVRFVDRYGNVSDLSPISAAYTTAPRSGTITDASNATPIVITSAGHGLSTGDTVKVEAVQGNDAANGTFTVTVLSLDTFSLDTSAGNGTYGDGGTWTAGVATLTYSGLPVSTEPKVIRRQLLRNTDGQTQTFYVDVDTTDLSSTSLSSTRTDSDLSAQTAVPIFDEDGDPLANSHGVPPDTKVFLAHHLDRMFAAGEVEYNQGNVSVTLGDATVTGIGTEWSSVLPGRFLFVVGASRSFEILSVDTVAQTLELTEPYDGDVGGYQSYAIRPVRAGSRQVAYSQAGEPESWPAINAFALPEDGDTITGLMTMGSFLYILERKHIYRFTAQQDPKTDGYVFQSGRRGCINNRCWVVVEDVAYMLDEAGVHGFQGGQEAEPLSGPIQDLFDRTNPTWRVNWSGSPWWHAAHYPQQEVIRWFVTLSGEYLPRHALGFHYREKRWWLEEYPVPMGASATGRLNSQPQVFLGSEADRVLAAEQGTLDGTQPDQGTVRGTVTSATRCSLTDTLARFDTTLVNVPVVIVSGTGKGQRRLIVSATATTLTVSQPWSESLDTTSVYQVGGIQWKWKSGWFRFAFQQEQSTPTRIEVLLKPLASPATMDLRHYFDRSRTARPWKSTLTGTQTGITVTAGDTDLVADLSRDTGYIQQRYDRFKELYADGPRFVQWELAGVQNADPVQVYQVLLEGVQQG